MYPCLRMLLPSLSLHRIPASALRPRSYSFHPQFDRQRDTRHAISVDCTFVTILQPARTQQQKPQRHKLHSAHFSFLHSTHTFVPAECMLACQTGAEKLPSGGRVHAARPPPLTLPPQLFTLLCSRTYPGPPLLCIPWPRLGASPICGQCGQPSSAPCPREEVL